jgi:hypothetical protein
MTPYRPTESKVARTTHLRLSFVRCVVAMIPLLIAIGSFRIAGLFFDRPGSLLWPYASSVHCVESNCTVARHGEPARTVPIPTFQTLEVRSVPALGTWKLVAVTSEGDVDLLVPLDETTSSEVAHTRAILRNGPAYLRPDGKGLGSPTAYFDGDVDRDRAEPLIRVRDWIVIVTTGLVFGWIRVRCSHDRASRIYSETVRTVFGERTRGLRYAPETQVSIVRRRFRWALAFSREGRRWMGRALPRRAAERLFHGDPLR